ncbi:MAG: DUF72 domain-containing protein [Thermoleophilaceae bacterium]|nr:DUF72 domain-containing protein [Thermoleophilaceae bacterium]
MTGSILVGTSSWADPGFIEEWYPKDLPAKDRLSWYAERFEAVEVNASFYAVPERKTVERWVSQTPAGFIFDVKLHRLLSRHSADLRSLPPGIRGEARTSDRGRVQHTPELEQMLAGEVLDAVEPLVENGRFGAFLLQMTPAFSPKRNDIAELDPLLQRLAPHPVAVELRNRSWVDGEQAQHTFAHLSEQDAVWVGVDAPPGDHMTIMPPVDAVTNERLAYLRAHGRNTEGYLKGKSVAERFDWDYSDSELGEIAGRATKLAEDAEVVHVLMNNNRGRAAPTDGRRFRKIVGQDPGPPVEAGQQLELG